MRNAYNILRTADTPASQADDPLRLKFEELHGRTVGNNNFDRVVHQDGD